MAFLSFSPASFPIAARLFRKYLKVFLHFACEPKLEKFTLHKLCPWILKFFVLFARSTPLTKKNRNQNRTNSVQSK